MRQFWLVQSPHSDYKLWTAQSSQFENLYISSHGETRNIKFGYQVNLIQSVQLGPLKFAGFTLIFKHHLGNTTS